MPVARTVTLACACLCLLACSSQPKPGAKPAGSAQVVVDDGSTAKITAFAVSEENLTVDKISMREGAFVGDGNRDLAFTATVEGPIDAFFLLTTTEKGDPLHHFRADTIIGSEELPGELGSVVDVGRMTEWMAISENGKFINNDSGTVSLARGVHHLKIYVPNTGSLRGSTFLRLYGRIPRSEGKLVKGPVVPY